MNSKKNTLQTFSTIQTKPGAIVAIAPLHLQLYPNNTRSEERMVHVVCEAASKRAGYEGKPRLIIQTLESRKCVKIFDIKSRMLSLIDLILISCKQIVSTILCFYTAQNGFSPQCCHTRAKIKETE